MAWIWELAAENKSREDAQRFVDSFDVTPIVVGDLTVRLSASVHEEDGWWGLIIPFLGDNPWTSPGRCLCAHGGAADEAEAERLTAVGKVLYARLAKAHPYRYAAVGVEVCAWIAVEELRERICEEPEWVTSTHHGLVLARDVWIEAGSPAGFSTFGDGDLWVPWRGESRPKP